MNQMEKVYKTMRNTGAGNIAIGVIIAVTGLTVGIVAIDVYKRQSPTRW